VGIGGKGLLLAWFDVVRVFAAAAPLAGGLGFLLGRAFGRGWPVAKPVEEHRYKQGCEAFPETCQRVYDFDRSILMDGPGDDSSLLQLRQSVC